MKNTKYFNFLQAFKNPDQNVGAKEAQLTLLLQMVFSIYGVQSYNIGRLFRWKPLHIYGIEMTKK